MRPVGTLGGQEVPLVTVAELGERARPGLGALNLKRVEGTFLWMMRFLNGKKAIDVCIYLYI